MLMKLALSGMKSKYKDYIVLLAGLVMSISIFYMFQTMAWNRSFTEENAIINSIQLVYILGSVLLSSITFFYILYANGFLLSLRQREFGLYMVLGARKSKIRSLMFIETIALGFISLAAGLALGFGLSELVGQLIAKQLNANLSGYHAVYMPAVLFTAFFFVILFALSAIWNQLKLARLQVLQLVHGSVQADRMWQSSFWKVLLAVVGLIALGLGYVSLTFMEQLREIGLYTATVMTPLGTYLLFMTLLPPLVAKWKKSNNTRGIKAFTYGQLSFRINGLTKLLATVAMLIALGAGAISGGMAFVNDAKIKGESYSVYDAIVHDPTAEVEAVLAEIPFTERLEYRYKIENELIYFAKEDLESHRPFASLTSNQKYGDPLNRITEALPTGADDRATPYSEEWQDFLSRITPDQSLSYRIVDEQSLQKLQSDEKVIVIGKTSDFLANRSSWEALDKLAIDKNNDDYMSWSKYQYYQYALGNATGTLFMGFFLGIAFLAMMASCLMFKILSGAAKDVQRYEMLSKLGVRREKLSRSIYHELFLVFLFPGIAGLLHVLVGMNLFSFILAEPYYRIWIPIALFAAIYSGYYLLTVRLYRNIVLPGRSNTARS
ncbi:ABC transporter permease [Paenibacillus sp. PL91]|uniref:ABC transporter permease n=1 Tax=Paenibacillus sp. PL91 TaxID=2729538 RepID=UPI00145FCF63|nr:ABC transporter permease [Paenibacillus sp. PL91]MBC9202664.1 ABC transporter permease [Paenibacillus sp. PL91]